MAPRPGIPTATIVLAVVRRGDRFLVVQEVIPGNPWYLPAGRAELGESLVAAVQREVWEEAGLQVTVDGILRIEHTPSAEGARLRVFVTARVDDDRPPKSTPDGHTLQAKWATLDEIAALHLRGGEVLDACRHVLHGGVVHPLSLWLRGGAPWA
jgi:phosphatase NudJ